ncbi:MAG: DNA translocase FtsK 4TM domain-containing protein, partial [Bacteroidota bacterium]|nr:DNA translocase FtsK 4TM domain-containing protein [Bacteroidota bacterium]
MANSIKSSTSKKNTLKNELAQPKPAPKAKTKRKTKPASRTNFFKDDRVHKIAGMFLLLLGVYLSLAIISYVVNYFSFASDDSFTNQATVHKIFFNSTGEIHNWMGKMGAYISDVLVNKWFGISSLLISIFIISTGLRLLKYRNILLMQVFWYSVFCLLWTSITFGFVFQFFSELLILGGSIGYQTTLWLQGIFGKPGLGIILFFSLMSFLVLVYNINIHFNKKRNLQPDTIVDEETGEIIAVSNARSQSRNSLKEDKYNTAEFAVQEEEDERDQDIPDDEYEPPVLKKAINQPTTDYEINVNDIPFMHDAEEKKQDVPLNSDRIVELTIENQPVLPIKPEPVKPISTKDHFTIDEPFDPTLELSDYKLPPLDLMNEYGGRSKVQREEIEANSQRIVETLRNYAIEIEKIKATVGPAVTLYEIIPAPGVRISKIKNLEDDIALSLSALGIRIIAPIPGKGTIGIEVPNQKPDIVSMKSILDTDAFQNSKYELPFGMGKNIANEAFIADLTKMPHILMAGATGQGKSVGLNAIITSLLYKKHPSELKFVMIDPKKVELTLFSKIERHFLAKLPDCEEAIITDTRVVVRTLNSLCIEMDNRYDLMKDALVRNIKEYNDKFKARKLNPLHGHRFLPYIVVVIDEFADLIMTAGKEVELPLTRLAQLARAIGIHLIIATQRPSVNIITGSIKANFPARIAFRV